MATSLKLTRNQLASFLKDPEQIKQFERLILLVNDYLNSGEVAGLSDTLGSVIAATNANAARLQDVIDTLDKAPRYEAVQDDPCCPPPVDLAPVLDRLQALELAPMESSNLAEVALTGSYLDLSNRPNDGVWYLRKDNSAALTNTTALQRMFDVTANGAMILEVGTYIFDWFFNLTGMSATTGNALISIIGAGTANINSGLIHAVGIDGAANTIATQNGKWIQANATTGNLFTATTATTMTASIRGTFYCGTAGTIIPSIGLTTAIGTATVTANSYCMVTKVTTPPATTRGSVS